MRALWAGQMGVREIEGRGSVSVPWTGARTDVSAASPPPCASAPPSSAALPASSSAPPASSAALVSVAGTSSLPAWSSAGPKDKEHTAEGR